MRSPSLTKPAVNDPSASCRSAANCRPDRNISGAELSLDSAAPIGPTPGIWRDSAAFIGLVPGHELRRRPQRFAPAAAHILSLGPGRANSSRAKTGTFSSVLECAVAFGGMTHCCRCGLRMSSSGSAMLRHRPWRDGRVRLQSRTCGRHFSSANGAFDSCRAIADQPIAQGDHHQAACCSPDSNRLRSASSAGSSPRKVPQHQRYRGASLRLDQLRQRLALRRPNDHGSAPNGASRGPRSRSASVHRFAGFPRITSRLQPKKFCAFISRWPGRVLSGRRLSCSVPAAQPDHNISALR